MEDIIDKKSRSKAKIILFASVGVFNTLFNVVVFDWLLLVGINALWSNFLSLVVSIVISFFLNKYLVFKDDRNFRGTQLIYFMLGTFAIQIVVQHLAVWWLGEHFTAIGQLVYSLINSTNLHLSEKFVILNTAKILGVGGSLLVTYLFYDKLIFKKHPRSQGSSLPRID